MTNTDFVFDPGVASAVPGKSHVPGPAKDSQAIEGPLSPAMLDVVHRYWLAANYLTVGQIRPRSVTGHGRAAGDRAGHRTYGSGQPASRSIQPMLRLRSDVASR